MLKYTLTILFFICTFTLGANFLHAQTVKSPTKEKLLKVGIAGSAPFVFQNREEGIAVEIWKKIAEKKSWDYKFVPFTKVEEALRSLNKGELDLVVGPISITAKRLEYIRFSQPFYNSSISILSRIENKNLWQRIKPFFRLELLIAVAVFLIILGVVGTLFWLAERKASPEQFSNEPIPGIGSGMWLAIVTMSTTGYGDKAPITFFGRVIAGTWMVVSIIFATSMIAGIASVLTLSTIDSTTISNIEQLSGKKVATVVDSPSVDFLKKSNAKIMTVAGLGEAIEKLRNKEVEAVVYDRPQILFYMKEHDTDDLYISKAEYYKQGYGFAFTTKSQFVLDVNRALLGLTEDQVIEKIIHQYIAKDE